LQDTSNMKKTKIVFTTRWLDVFTATHSQQQDITGELSPSLYNNPCLERNKYYRLFGKDGDNEIEIIAMNHLIDGECDENRHSFIKWVIHQFCSDSPDECYLMLHAGTDIPGGNIGLYEGGEDLYNGHNNTQLHVWGIKHQNAELGGSTLLLTSYGKVYPSASLIYHRVKALFLASAIKKAWDEYYDSMGVDDNRRNKLYSDVQDLLVKMNDLSDVAMTVDMDLFNSMRNDDDPDTQEGLILKYWQKSSNGKLIFK